MDALGKWCMLVHKNMFLTIDGLLSFLSYLEGFMFVDSQ